MANDSLKKFLTVAGGLAMAAPALAGCNAVCGACGACSAYGCGACAAEKGEGCGACSAEKAEGCGAATADGAAEEPKEGAMEEKDAMDDAAG